MDESSKNSSGKKTFFGLMMFLGLVLVVNVLAFERVSLVGVFEKIGEGGEWLGVVDEESDGEMVDENGDGEEVDDEIVDELSDDLVASESGKEEVGVERVEGEIGKNLTVQVGDGETDRVVFKLRSYEITDEVVIKGQMARAVKDRKFVLVYFEVANIGERGMRVNTREYFRLSIDGREDWKAPEFHNDPLEAQVELSVGARVGFAVDEEEEVFVLQVGDEESERFEVEIGEKL